MTNIGRPEGTLETVCVLSLPELTMSVSLESADCFGEHPGHALFSKCWAPISDSVSAPVFPFTFMSTRHPPPPEGLGPHRQLRHVPADSIISILMNIRALPVDRSFNSPNIDLCVRSRTLLAFANKAAQARAGEGGGGGAMLTVPWEEWGPKNTRVRKRWHEREVSFGERRVTVDDMWPTLLTMRDYNPFRVRRARARTGGAGNEIRLNCGSVMRVVDEISTYRDREMFADDVESSLPYVETVTPYEECRSIFMDEDNLLVEVPLGSMVSRVSVRHL